MPYITREDGERFVIPSYRDVLAAKQKSVLKNEILSLSQNYGGYITMQRKGPLQYEVAFSPDTGYLLGESIWSYFKKPLDLIYCEVIPNTTEAILVIVKSGSVYLDGSFPIDSIPEELVIFLTEQNNFEIYVYGNVPIGQTPEEGKFSFEPTSVKSFTVLDKPVFPTLPLVKNYQLQPVDQVLKAQGIGVFPAKQALIGIIAIAGLWMAWSYLSTPKVQEVQVAQQPQVNPYQGFLDALTSPSPDEQVDQALKLIKNFFDMPGWIPKSFNCGQGSVVASVMSTGSPIEKLTEWASENDYTVAIRQDGIYVAASFNTPNRLVPKSIYSTKAVLADLIDKLLIVYPGNHVQLGDFVNKTVYTQINLNIAFDQVSPLVLSLIGKQLKGLPLVFQGMPITVDDGKLTGSMNFIVLGS